MKNKRKVYESPIIEVTNVDLKDSIASSGVIGNEELWGEF